MNCNTDCLTYETSCNAHLNVRNVIAFSHRILPTRNVIIFDNANGQRCKLKKKIVKTRNYTLYIGDGTTC